MNLWEIENEHFAKGFFPICGCDEAGAGPLAGPVYAGAVILPPGLDIPDLNDSKKLSEKKRDALFDVICEKAVAWAVASVDEKTIDAINILNARMLAMERAIAALNVPPALALIDGTISRGIAAAPCVTVKGGDGRSANIAAASILAKVSRDRYMAKQAALYPQYQFGKHKGYGTTLHYALLREFGPCPLHRVSFLKNLAEREKSSPARL